MLDAVVLDVCGGEGRVPLTLPLLAIVHTGKGTVLEVGKPRFTSYWLCDLEQMT